MFVEDAIMQGFMNTPLTNDELLDLGINIAWVPQPTHLVTYVALHDYVKDFMERGSVAYQDFREAHKDNPYVSGGLKIGGAEVAKQRELEEKYFSAEAMARILEKHTRVTCLESLEAAVAAADENARSGDVVLLAPACASFDQFSSYEERGECFRTAVEQRTGGDSTS